MPTVEATITDVQTLDNGEISAVTYTYPGGSKTIAAPQMPPGRGMVAGRLSGDLLLAGAAGGLPQGATPVDPQDLIDETTELEV